MQSPQQATCGPAIFGRTAKIQIQNVQYEKVLDDCRGCNQVSSWKEQSPVIGYEKKQEQEWNQVLVAKRRSNDRYYSLAFDKKDGEEVKVVTDNGNGKVVAKVRSRIHNFQNFQLKFPTSQNW